VAQSGRVGALGQASLPVLLNHQISKAGSLACGWVISTRRDEHTSGAESRTERNEDYPGLVTICAEIIFFVWGVQEKITATRQFRKPWPGVPM
jgi:hypothetical protein